MTEKQQTATEELTVPVVLKIKRTKERADGRRVSMVGFFGPEQKELVQMMYGSASEDYLLLLESLGDFFEKEIEPTARQIDVKAEFPRENIRKLFEQGFTSMGFPKDFGGLELPGLFTSQRWKCAGRLAP